MTFNILNDSHFNNINNKVVFGTHIKCNIKKMRVPYMNSISCLNKVMFCFFLNKKQNGGWTGNQGFSDPRFFFIFTSTICPEIFSVPSGITLYTSRRAQRPACAKDVVLTTGRAENFRTNLKDLERKTKRMSLEIEEEKSKLTGRDEVRVRDLYMDDGFKGVEEFKYPGGRY